MNILAISASRWRRSPLKGGADGAYLFGDVPTPLAEQRLQTAINGQLRTAGIALFRPGRPPTNLYGLDIDRLAEAALAAPAGATARGKLLVVGDYEAAVFQLEARRNPALVACGHATAAVAPVLGLAQLRFRLHTHAGQIEVRQSRSSNSVSQVWALPGFTAIESVWRDRNVAVCAGANNYAVVVGPLPSGVSPARARRELVGDALDAKLAVIEPQAGSIPLVTTFIASGQHGAIPQTAALTLALLRRRSPRFAWVLELDRVCHPSPAGHVELQLPEVLIEPDGRAMAIMPTADVMLTPISF